MRKATLLVSKAMSTRVPLPHPQLVAFQDRQNLVCACLPRVAVLEMPRTHADLFALRFAGLYVFMESGPVIPLVTAPARNGKVTYLEKFGTSPANNSTGAYELDISLVGDADYNATWREMHVKSDIFCSASLTLPDSVGRQINVGGWADDATYGIRLYWPDGSPGVAGVNDWQENYQEVSLIDGRWYPSAMVMSNGSILVMGGEQGSNGAPVPSLEVLPSPSDQSL